MGRCRHHVDDIVTAERSLRPRCGSPRDWLEGRRRRTRIQPRRVSPRAGAQFPISTFLVLSSDERPRTVVADVFVQQQRVGSISPARQIVEHEEVPPKADLLAGVRIESSKQMTPTRWAECVAVDERSARLPPFEVVEIDNNLHRTDSWGVVASSTQATRSRPASDKAPTTR